MPLIVDGHNVLRGALPASWEGLDEAGLCRLLGRTPWAKTGVTVVFDGHPGPLGTLESPAAGVDLRWSGRGVTADEVIIGMVDAHPSPRSLVVVSSDHEIRLAARERRATSWSSDELVTRVLDVLRPEAGGGGESKPSAALGPGEVARWLAEFGVSEGGGEGLGGGGGRLPQPKRRPPVT